MLVTKLKDDDTSKISFRSFTVGTSLEFKGNSTGRKEEREFIIYLLKKTGLIKGLWENTLEGFFKQSAKEIDTKRDFKISDDFVNLYKELLEDGKLSNIKELISISDKEKHSQLIIELRKLLILVKGIPL